MSAARILAAGALGALPIGALLACRYAAARRFLDGRARRTYVAKAAAAAAASFASASLVATAGRSLVLPFHWAMIAAAIAIALLARALRRGP